MGAPLDYEQYLAVRKLVGYTSGFPMMRHAWDAMPAQERGEILTTYLRHSSELEQAEERIQEIAEQMRAAREVELRRAAAAAEQRELAEIIAAEKATW